MVQEEPDALSYNCPNMLGIIVGIKDVSRKLALSAQKGRNSDN